MNAVFPLVRILCARPRTSTYWSFNGLANLPISVQTLVPGATFDWRSKISEQILHWKRLNAGATAASWRRFSFSSFAASFLAAFLLWGLEDSSSSSSSSCSGCGFGSWGSKDDMDVGAKREVFEWVRERSVLVVVLVMVLVWMGLREKCLEAEKMKENENNVWRVFFLMERARLNLVKWGSMGF